VVDPVKNIQSEQKKAVDVIKIYATRLGNEAFRIVMDLLEKEFDFKGGKFVADKTFIEKLNNVTIRLLEEIQKDPTFTSAISQFVKRLPPISDALGKFQKQINGVTIPNFDVAKKIVVDETIDQFLNNGLNQNFAQPLRDLIYQNVNSGLSLKEARESIKDYIKGGNDKSGKLGRYLEMTARQSVSAYTGALNTKILQEYKYDALLIAGTIIDNTSPQCNFAINDLKGTIKRSDWPELEKMAKKNGLMPNTNFDNLPTNLLHWNCRHDFYPIKLK